MKFAFCNFSGAAMWCACTPRSVGFPRIEDLFEFDEAFGTGFTDGRRKDILLFYERSELNAWNDCLHVQCWKT